jgi:mRNA-degrading endonuclease RelE of RelBE toxin-antitoxin system
MTENQPTIEVSYTSEFKRNIRRLSKKYRRIKSDVQGFIDLLTQGETPGDRISGVQFEVYKVRIRNSDTTKGKSGGYRIIYLKASNDSIVLVTVYSKTEQDDITPDEIREIILDEEAMESDLQSSENSTQHGSEKNGEDSLNSEK